MTSDDAINFLMAKADEILNVALVIKGLKKDSEELKKIKCLQNNEGTLIYSMGENGKLYVTSRKVEGLAANDDDRGNEIMEKPILRKDGRFMQRISYQGKRICVYGNTEYEVEVKARKKRKELKETEESQKPKKSNNKSMTLNEWFVYYAEFKKQRVKESTWLRIEEYYNRHLKNTLGPQKMAEITPEMLQNLINGLLYHSAKEKVIQQLRDLFDSAYKSGKLKNDPMALVVLPKKEMDDRPVDQTEKTVKILTYENEKRLLPLLERAGCYHATKFIIYTGLRRGEVLGLTWKDVDFERQTVTVSQQKSLATKKITSPKTKAAYRTIPILPKALEVLTELNQKPHTEDDFVFKDLNRLSQQLSYYSRVLGIEVTPHMLRHTFASRCYAAGLDPKIMQQILGHEDIKTSLNVYTHVLDATNREIVEEMRNFFISKGLIIVRV